MRSRTRLPKEPPRQRGRNFLPRVSASCACLVARVRLAERDRPGAKGACPGLTFAPRAERGKGALRRAKGGFRFDSRAKVGRVRTRERGRVPLVSSVCGDGLRRATGFVARIDSLGPWSVSYQRAPAILREPVFGVFSLLRSIPKAHCHLQCCPALVRVAWFSATVFHSLVIGLTPVFV